jgi:hypothetical protein
MFGTHLKGLVPGNEPFLDGQSGEPANVVIHAQKVSVGDA